MAIVAKVWIDDDCITCDACQDICPEVFQVTEESSQILAAVRTDGVFDRNTGGALLVGNIGTQFGDIIIEAAEACPVEVIKFELVSDGAETSEVVAESPVTLTVAAAPLAAAPISAGASAALSEVMSGERTLNILFGSQTGNAAGLAEKTAKLADKYGLTANIIDMEGFNPASLSSMKRVMIITSTWGEGEMPDNADGLWKAINANGPALAGVHYSVCAIGDRSYDEFCKAGHDWDHKLAALGGTEAYPLQECDVDFEPAWKVWVNEALPLLACVNASGTLQLELLDEMKAYGAGGDDDVASGDYTPGIVLRDEVKITLEVFRYCPEAAQSGWDALACSVPGHATLEDLLLNIQRDVDGSFAFRRGHVAGTPTTGVRANGRIVLADATMVGDVVKDGGRLRIEPLPGHPVVRDLIVDLSRYESHRSRAEPWMRTDPREGERLPSGMAMGTMDAIAATALHQAGDVLSFQLIQGMSDTLPHDPHYEGPGVHFQQWLRVIDPRTSEQQRRDILTSLQENDGVWSEADHASLMRYGEDGRLAARALNEARGMLLNQHRYAGKSGRLVKWYGRSVKWTGNVNETTLYRQVLGPLGLVSNIFSGVSARMALAFTRNGGPPLRSLQGLLAPPAGIGRIPKMINDKVEAYHEVVSLFNEIDQRF